MIARIKSAFDSKLKTIGYPMTGFWIQLGSSLDDDEYTNWIRSSTDLINCDTIIDKDYFTISFDLLNRNIELNEITKIYLIALDYLRYTDIQSDFTGPKDPKLFNQIGGIIEIEDADLTKVSRNIIQIPISIKCALQVNYDPQSPIVSHYDSMDIGASNYYSLDPLDAIHSISVESGLDKIRELSRDSQPHKLNGVFTIRKSGIIQI